MQNEQRTATLDEINQALVATSDIDDLMDLLAKGLPRLEIPGCYVSLYENPVVPMEWCRNILAYKDGQRVGVEKDKQRFSSWQLVPGDMLPQDKPYSLLVEPLYFRENQIGIAVFDVGPREGTVYETLRGQLSSALWGARLVQYLQSLYEASSTVISLQEPQAILQDVVEQACKAVGAKWANVVLVDKEGRPQRLAVGGHRHSSFETSTLVSNEPVLIENMQTETGILYKQMAKEGVGAAGCFPLYLRGRAVGSLWIFYEKPHCFPDTEVNALRLYANQAAIAYDKARRMEELEHLRQIAEKLASVAEIQDVLKQIVRSALDVLQADSAVIWSYNAARNVFLPAELVAAGVDPKVLERYREIEPRSDGTASIIFQKGYLAVTDVNDAKYAYLGPGAHGLREAINVKSFQGIALEADGELLGVIYVNYRSPQIFDEGDESTLRAFAYHAALALKKARLLEQVKRAHSTSRVVAEVSVLEDLQRTLKAIVEGTKNALGCDAVVLFVYNQVTDRLDHPPIMVGVNDPDKASSAGEVKEDSIVYIMLRRDEPYLVDVEAQDPLFRERRFAKDEGIVSCAAVPLRVAGQKVGVMFVNYRTRHRFTGEERADIALFADQAAVAIRNAQLYEETTRRTAYLQALFEASKIITSTLALDEILNRIVEQASLLTSETGGRQAHFCYLALKENGRLRFKATYSPTHASNIVQRSFIIDLEHDDHIGIVGRAVRTGQSQLVNDVTKDPDYRRDDLGTRSELAVPIKMSNEVIGVIDVEHPEPGSFNRDDQRALEALAAQAAIAIQNARQYDELKRVQGLVGARTALAWMGMASNTWRHDIDKHALTIKDQIDLLRQDLTKLVIAEKNPSPYERLSMIQRLAKQIREKPITPPLSAEEGVASVSINGLIRERIKQLWENEPYKSVEYQLKLTLDDSKTVWASQEWLRRALDILIDNGIDAMGESPRRVIAIETRQNNNQLIVHISDTGKGIPEKLIPHLFHDQIEKAAGSKGLGMGLLMAQAIIQTYGGEIGVHSTGQTGTTMYIQLPLEVPGV
jgi:GAF domain-containing protein